MGALFISLGIGYSSRDAKKVAIDTVDHHILNAKTRLCIQQPMPKEIVDPRIIRNGRPVQSIEKIFNQFTYGMYSVASSDKESSEFMKDIMQQILVYFQDLNEIGIKSELFLFYNAWQSVYDDPQNNVVKSNLAKQTQIITQKIQNIKSQIAKMQNQLNNELKTQIDQVNQIAKSIVTLNLGIAKAEARQLSNIDDLLDQRNNLSISLANLIGSNLLNSNNVSINGCSIIDGTEFHPLNLHNNNPTGMYEIFYELKNVAKQPLTQEIKGGTVGAILNLRGSELDITDGYPINGILQNISDQLDRFAFGLIQNTNNIYAQSATTEMTSNQIVIDSNDPIINIGLGINKGVFDVIVYNINGDLAAKCSIKIDDLTTFSSGVNSIKTQIEMNGNGDVDENSINDINSFLSVKFTNGIFSLNLKNSILASQGYTFAIKDNLDATGNYSYGTNFVGALRLHQFFQGSDASNIDLAANIKKDPTYISASTTSISNNNDIAMFMMQSQFETFNFTQKNKDATYQDTISGMFDTIVTNITVQTNNIIAQNDILSARLSAVKKEYDSITKISIDEEMKNLIAYQASYDASTKIIATIDQMMNTPLDIKHKVNT